MQSNRRGNKLHSRGGLVTGATIDHERIKTPFERLFER